MSGRYLSRILILIPLWVVSACGPGEGEGTKGSQRAGSGDAVTAQVASYDLATGRDQRVLVGLVAGEGRVISFGTARFSFAYIGTRDERLATPEPGPTATAAWLPIPGQKLVSVPAEARRVEPSEGVGVYAARGVRFDRPGFWQVTATIDLDGQPAEAKADLEVSADPVIVAPGEAAPRSQNHLPEAPDVPARAVDSRAAPDGAVPDPELHTATVAAAIASGRPTMVVIATPVYCQSRFCGPITDSVQRLAQVHGGRMNFVHLEVWRNFRAKQVNEAAAEWIYPPGAEDVREPWVFLVGADGNVLERFDNVASDAELNAAVTSALS